MIWTAITFGALAMLNAWALTDARGAGHDQRIANLFRERGYPRHARIYEVTIGIVRGLTWVCLAVCVVMLVAMIWRSVS